jgi:hypothetical protein
MTGTASIGLVVYALTASFAAIDWIESLAPEMHSSRYCRVVSTARGESLGHLAVVVDPAPIRAAFLCHAL